VASGCRARSKADWILEETDESLLWLELAEEGSSLPGRRIEGLKREAGELTAIFAAIHKSSKS
jgi:hypothetical protein